MNLTLDQLETEAAKLSAAERHALIDRLRDLDGPVDAGVEAEWDAVISRRAQEVMDGSVKTLDAFEVLAEFEKDDR